jgi:hypothetical protein
LAGILISIGTTVSQKSFNSEGVGLEMSLFCVDLMWNDPAAESLFRDFSKKSAIVSSIEYLHLSAKTIQRRMTFRLAVTI